MEQAARLIRTNAMQPLQITLLAVLVFFCLWTALFARLKGYSAACWFLSGGFVGVIVLCLLPTATPVQSERKRNANLLGLILSAISVFVAYYLVPDSI